jgi:phage terminase large subunit
LAITIELPEILRVPDKLIPVITKVNDYRYCLLDGGRGGGKSQMLGRFILYIAEQRRCRIVCGRETQNTISESVYSLLSDLITQYNLAFDIQASKIIHKESGSTINFRGFREQGRFNIQGLEGIDVLWIDEGQAITKQTLDVLIPTIRKEKAKIFFSMNRHVEHDPVYETFYNRPDCLHIHLNYNDNPFCTEALKNEALECQKKSEADYNHIWLGEPLAQTEDALFVYKELKDTRLNKHIMTEHYGIKLGGFDIARYGDDKCACVVVQQMGALQWEVSFTDQWDHKDLNYTTGRILTTSMEQDLIKSIIDEDGIGAGPLDTLNKGRNLDNFTGFKNPSIGYKDNKFFGNNRTVNAYKTKEMVSRGHLVITQEDLIRELCTLRYTYDHNQRKILISKDKMRKDGVKSPNLADALIMAVSLIGDINYKQIQQYQIRQPQYSREDNLFQTAGVR